MKKHNFFAGPAVLPLSVLDEASKAVKEYQNIGLSLIEISHRGKEIVAIMDEARALIKELYKLPDNYEVLFLTGGASTQFCMIPYNMLNESETAAYINTGAWATKAIKEAKLFGNTEVVASSEDTNFNYIPKDYKSDASYKYLHITSNNTIYGTQWANLPDTDCSLIVDMSSDIFCKELDATKADLIYAGAQKNLGPAGTTIVIVNKDKLGTVDRAIPTMLNYDTHVKKDSSFNTPPVFPIYVCYLTLKWIKEQGGIAAIEKTNRRKAAKLYAEIDRNPLFEGTAALDDRSLMNVTFVPKEESHTSKFIEYAESKGCMGLKGHRSVGGFRASIYNALEESSVDHLISVMQEFENEV